MLITNLYIKRVNEFNFMNKKNILNAPITEPSNILLSFIFLLSIIETLNKSKKSKAKFRNRIRSKYIFI